ncbi:MAG: carbamoyl phosphate synthase large subunit [Deltaproteobacteria bacterium RIFOXYA12_FULL_58_15]|nr:MAG: carbamoyl phosphate synthase large subunit [Deltaproteobacteria bacterium RIFOXYA12_FULL_58_15]OGR10146.1 MAG: carbamoyl phosphate synthase large subunit [Deltaproteobacteria bacterium RIFOXYB12_FULL_58_9]
MPKRADLKKILVIGSGPIVIGQACEFDYSGTQAIKALKAEGIEVVLVNSNPATIMTDPDLADRTYIEPLTPEYVTAVIERERPDAILPTVGGQTALNLTLSLAESGVLTKFGVEVIGASVEAIKVAEDRELFRTAMQDIGLDVPVSRVVSDVKGALELATRTGYPVIVRPSFTLGGSGGGIAYNSEELDEVVRRGINLSPVGQVLVEESLLGWKEFELEVVRDANDNVIIVCSIENFDPMGVHTGDSLTVAPAQTLTDVEYQVMRDAAVAILRRVRVDTGGSNVQFAVRPEDGRLSVIEMNPRVSRSSALASKATGFPIAKVAAKLAIGYTLDEIANDITKTTPAAFEPAIDYVVTKIPKFAFEKFPGASETLGTQMKSVGEVMAIGRTFKESLFKALRSLEVLKPFRPKDMTRAELIEALSEPNERRVRYVVHALEQGFSIEELNQLTRIDEWFLDQLLQVAEFQKKLRGKPLAEIDDATIRRAKEIGLSDRRLAYFSGSPEAAVRARRRNAGIIPVYKRVDTCAAEFASHTPYLYSTYEEEDEAQPENVKKVMILGSGPNRIGQGIEFDYCCCHAAYALRDAGVQSIMVNCNPETVSTDYDTSDRLYFEPLTLEDVLEIVYKEKPDGVIVQFGGQTPLNLTRPLHEAGIKILGTSPESVDLAEDREKFCVLLDSLGVLYPEHAFANDIDEARIAAEKLGYPLLVRPSYVLGGRAMAVVYGENELVGYVRAAIEAAPQGAILIDRFLEDAIEVDVDAVSDGEDCIIAGIMEHVEQAGVHSGDSTCVLPGWHLADKHVDEIRASARALAMALKVVGLMNVQYAVAGGRLYVLEVNPRASRTVPYVSKATGVPLAKVATRLMLGQKLSEIGLARDLTVDRFFIKTPVFPFVKFPGVDPRLSPEMKSTGEVMGIAKDVGTAFYKASLAAGIRLPQSGTAFITVNRRDKEAVVDTARKLVALGFDLLATRGTASVLRSAGLPVSETLKRSEGRPNCVDAIRSGQINLIVNTPLGGSAYKDGWEIRTAALQHQVPCITTLSGAIAAVEAIASQKGQALTVVSLQELEHLSL